MHRGNTRASALPAGALALSATAAHSQGELMIYPKQGQSADQQSRDRYECHTWSVQQSGYDPSDPQPSAPGQQAYQRAMATCLEGRGYISEMTKKEDR